MKKSSLFARVHELVRSIPPGRVATYGQLSQLIGRRLTPVGIGWALAHCDQTVPWHRVINSKGGTSTPGPRQRILLESEGVEFRPNGTVDLARYLTQPFKKRQSSPQLATKLTKRKRHSRGEHRK
jgi:methylated-DNA-protein-cysteine methyltransferase related protein